MPSAKSFHAGAPCDGAAVPGALAGFDALTPVEAPSTAIGVGAGWRATAHANAPRNPAMAAHDAVRRTRLASEGDAGGAGGAAGSGFTRPVNGRRRKRAETPDASMTRSGKTVPRARNAAPPIQANHTPTATPSHRAHERPRSRPPATETPSTMRDAPLSITGACPLSRNPMPRNAPRIPNAIAP